ncbi:hypothetical protein PWT90_04165 [Aphanocladium album]|nr:hypothetical protein PWT90_04165 [Aphanocladium album]
MRFSLLAVALPLAAAGPIIASAPLHTRDSTPAHMLDRYIVKFRAGSAGDTIDAAALQHITGQAPYRRFQNAFFSGFAAQLTPEAVTALRLLPDVEYVEQDHESQHHGKLVSQSRRLPWGLARISQRELREPRYDYDSSAGKGVCVYMTDTGIDDSHPEFGGRAKQIKSFIKGSNVDDNGHGTHTAGTVASKTYGVAKQARLFGVKVSNAMSRFTYSDLIAAYDWITLDARNRTAECPHGFVVSSSVGGDYSRALNDAATSLVEAGFFLAVSAGNDGKDAATISPASAAKACTVGGSDSRDYPYEDSNWGPKVNIIGPAVEVYSTLPGGTYGLGTGTSMAAPHVAGLAAYLASRDKVVASGALCDTIAETASKDVIKKQFRNTVNLLAFNGNAAGDYYGTSPQ